MVIGLIATVAVAGAVVKATKKLPNTKFPKKKKSTDKYKGLSY